MKSSKAPVVLVSIYLFIFAILSRLDIRINILLFMFSFSPFLILWMIYSVLRYGTYSGKELEKNEEWGYEDYIKVK